MKKRILTLALAICLALLLIPSVSAAQVSRSNQGLAIDGESVAAQAYNIDGSNYFRLRDLAYLLNGTGSQFSVDYDRQANTVVVVTGEAYSPIGTELAGIDAGEPGSVVPSPQSLRIDGQDVGGIDAYNIDGSNYYKLRDLGPVLDFDVDYDTGTRTMLIATRKTGGLPADWAPDISFTTVDADGNEWTDACFHEVQLTMINFWAYWCGPCCREMPDLQKLSEDYADKGLRLLGISYTEYEEDNVLTMADLGVTYPCLRYVEEFDSYLNTGYIPVTIFVDNNGKVVGEVYIGSNSYSGWAAIIDSLLP